MIFDKKSIIIDSYKLVDSKKSEDNIRLKFISIKEHDKRLMVLDFKVNYNFFENFSDLIKIVKSILSSQNNKKKTFIIIQENANFVVSSITFPKKKNLLLNQKVIIKKRSLL